MSPTDKPRQLPLDLGHASGLSRDDLVVSAANAAAVALLDRWPDWPAPIVVLAGPPGSGKSHMASVWQDASGALSLPGGAISAGALHRIEAGLPALIEDVDKEALDEKGLFHLINAVKASGTHLLITARSFPGVWGVSLPDLISRLKAAATVEIHEPDDVLLAGVITKLFADRQVDVEQHVVQFLARRIERSLATAIRIVERLDRVAMERQAPITRILAAEAVTAMDEGQGELPI